MSVRIAQQMRQDALARAVAESADPLPRRGPSSIARGLVPAQSTVAQLQPQPVYLPVAPIYRQDLERIPRPPMPQADERRVMRAYLASTLNDRTFSPLDYQPHVPYPGTQVTRDLPVGKPAFVQVPVRASIAERLQGPLPMRRPLAYAGSLKPNGALNMVLTDPEEPEQRTMQTMSDIIEYILGVHLNA